MRGRLTGNALHSVLTEKFMEPHCKLNANFLTGRFRPALTPTAFVFVIVSSSLVLQLSALLN